jgi:serine protease
MRALLVLIALAAGSLASSPTAAASGEYHPVLREQQIVDEGSRLHVIVKLQPESSVSGNPSKATRANRVQALAKRTGLVLAREREIAPDLVATQLDIGATRPEDALARLARDPGVAFVQPDLRRYPLAVPNDAMLTNQWYLGSAQISAINATAAWDRELGSTGIVVAVVDTGVIFDHPDLGRAATGGKLLPGYDFVSGPRSNDGDDWDSDASDPGDWLTTADRSITELANCSTRDSSWHGTRTAGIVGALTNNGIGFASVGWNVWVQPVRALGKCGGRDSDILAAIRWAAGLHVAGVPDNPTPARIINASFGAQGFCLPGYQQVIDELATRKALLVVAAGNEGSVVSSPGNCNGVATVAAIRHAGSKVGFSSLGPEVTLSAPGGNCVNPPGQPCLFSIDTTSNDGTTVPATNIYTGQLNAAVGTSNSAPIVAGIAGLMVSRNANLSTAQLIARLREAVVTFPVASTDPTVGFCHVPVDGNDVQVAECLCTTGTCGAGMAHALNSVEAADRPIAAIALPATVAAGQNVSFDASRSAAACNRSVASYSWTVVTPTVNPPALSNATTATTSLVAPTSGSVVLRVTVTDNLGKSDSALVTLNPSSVASEAPAAAGSTACAVPISSAPTPPPTGNPPVTPPSTPPKSGGGGGSFDLWTPVALALLVVWRSRRRRLEPIPRCI